MALTEPQRIAALTVARALRTLADAIEKFCKIVD
jgi:hypothetical protein